MFNRTIYTPMMAGLALLASASFADPVNAEDPGVIRTFAVFLAPGIELQDVDFTDDDAVLVKVEQNSNSAGTTIDFVDCNPEGISDFDFDGTRWRTQPAMFISKGEGRRVIGSFAWLLDETTPEPPPVGAVALVGSDELVLQEKVFVRTCTSNNCCSSSDAGKKSLTTNQSESRVIVVMAEFSK